MFGFAIRRLAVTGLGKSLAEVIFTRGLNVIAGPSDTGKSFIVQCLDYALGGGDTPKDIPEAEGYTTVVLEIESNQSQQVYKLERSLRGGDVRCVTENQSDRILAAKHKRGKKDTISQFLLELSGLGTKNVRTNERGTTRPLSFRDIARLVIIDEETVIKETSPVLSGQYTSKTVESSIFRLVLTGTDDSSITATEDPKITKGRQTGKAELLKSLLESTRERLSAFGDGVIISEERDRLAHIDAALQQAIIERDAAQANAAPLEAKRRDSWIALRAVDSKLTVLRELQTRFDLLQKQYASDLRRLDAITEAGVRLNQLKEEKCPTCGAFVEHSDAANCVARSAPDAVFLACAAEAAKTCKLIDDLHVTLAATANEVCQLQIVREAKQRELNVIASELKELMERHIEVLTRVVDELRVRKNNCEKALELLNRIQELTLLLEEANTPRKRQQNNYAFSSVSTAQANSFSMEVEALLRTWQFPSLDRVSFSETDQDVVVSGRARKSRGKGVRAIIRAAFNLALLRLCVNDRRPFPNFVLIDSPLLVYEEPDVDELSFPHDIKSHFWKSLMSTFNEAQVIIVENSKQLPSDSIKDANLILFTGNDQGRRGFFSAD